MGELSAKQYGAICALILAISCGLTWAVDAVEQTPQAGPPTADGVDQVLLRNGDRISGRILRKVEDTLTLETAYAGKLKIKWSEVVSLQSAQPVEIYLADRTILVGKLAQAATGEVRVESEVVNGVQPLLMEQVVYINPPPEISGRGVKLSGRVNLAYNLNEGNTEVEAFHVDGEMVARSKRNRYTLGGQYNEAEDRGVRTENNTTAYMKYDHFFSQHWYGYANGIFNKDRFKDLELRTALGLGSGYQVWESDALNLAVETGFNYVNEDFITAIDNSYPAARWSLKYDQLLFKKLFQVFHVQEFYFGLEDSDDIFARAETGIRLPLLDTLKATLQVNVEWDNTPSPGREKTDYDYLFGLGYHW